MYHVLSLFAGIGGFDLGLERTGGFRTVAFCEIDPFCRKVLAKHWPGVPCYHDVRELTGARLAADGIAVDVICGGFPCQDISEAGLGAGIDGEHSGLWSEYSRLIGELRPHFVIVENVAALLKRGLDRVLGCLAALGYDADWHCIPASAVGAPHRRDRVWIVAHPECLWWRQPSRSAAKARQPLYSTVREESTFGPRPSSEALANASSIRLEEQRIPAEGLGLVAHAAGIRRSGNHAVTEGHWTTEPDVGRVAHGVPSRVDRLRCLGNAVVPQIPELIGHAILASEGRP